MKEKAPSDWISRAKNINEWKQVLLLTTIGLAIIYARNPMFLLLPRVFAEEPGHYLANSLAEPFPSSLGVTMAGYFSIVPNIAAELAAKIFPLEYAAHVFTGVGLFIQLITIISVYFSLGRLLPNRFYSALSAIALLIIAKPETWLNTVYSMYWLATGMFYILNSRSIARFHIAYATLAFVTGPTSLIWLPLFSIRWLVGLDKANKKERKIMLILVIGFLGFAVNMFLTYFNASTTSIGSRLKPEMILNLPRGFSSMFFHLTASGGYPFVLSAAAIISLAILICSALTYEDKRFRVFTAGAMAYYGFVVAILSFEMQGGNRYALPITAGLFSLSVIGASNIILNGREAVKKWRLLVFAAIVLFVMGNKLIEFQDFDGKYAKSNYVYDRSWPNWKEQINAIDRSKGGVIKTFPQWDGTGLQGGNWYFNLKPGWGK
jgi:hypothetical protein